MNNEGPLRPTSVALVLRLLGSGNLSLSFLSLAALVWRIWEKPKSITELNDEKNLIDWLLKGFLALGHITILSALMKCGKTTFIALLLKALQSATTFLGQQIKNVNVLIISEEPESRWYARKTKYNLGEGIWLLCKPTFGKMSIDEWSEFLDHYAMFCVEKDIKIVIFDTLTTFSPVKDENNSSEVTESLLPLNKLLEKNIAILLIHHLRKAGGDEAIASRGSTALTAAVDIIMEFRRLSSNVGETQRVIRSYSRDDETPEELVINLNKETNEYEVMGTRQEVIQKAKADLLLRIIPVEPEGVTVEDIFTRWPEEKAPNKTTIFRRLKKLETDGWVKVVGKQEHEKGKPDLWARTSALQDKPLKDARDMEETIEDYELGNNFESVIEYVDVQNNTLDSSSINTETITINEDIPENDEIYILIKKLRDIPDRNAYNFPLRQSADFNHDELIQYRDLIKDYKWDTNPDNPNSKLYSDLIKAIENEIRSRNNLKPHTARDARQI